MTSGLRLCLLDLTISGLDQVPKRLPAAVDFKVESVTCNGYVAYPCAPLRRL